MSAPSTPKRLPVVVPGSVPSCHAAAPNAGAGAGAPVVTLVGTPNAGKSTLFNTLTGARVTVGNWPGTTVEVSRGLWCSWRSDSCECDHCTAAHGPGKRIDVTLVDLPGAYSLDPVSPDERLTRALLVDVPEGETPDVVVVTADAAHLARSLYLVSQVRERRQRVIVALTMTDIAARRGIEVDTYALSAALGCPVVGVDPRRRRGIGNLTQEVHRSLGEPAPAPRTRDVAADADELDIEDERFGWIEEAVRAGTRNTGTERVTWTDRIDRWTTAPVVGPLIFMAVMWAVFQITTTVAAPMQDALDQLFTGPVSSGVVWLLERVGLGGTWFQGFLIDGLIAGVGMLLTFVPLMALMFVLLALLEDSGYLARAAVVTDRLMHRIGLPGRAFLPLIVGFGCNVPAISATRILPNARHRLLTALLVPFTSCSARLTVYVLVATAFFGRYAGTVVFAMYLVSILFVVGVGLLLKSTLWRRVGADPLVIDLPPYQRPTVRLTASVTWQRLKGFLKTASGIIVATVCVVWVLQSIPVRGDQGFAEVPVEDSAYAVAAQTVAPVFEPAGFGEWKTTSALVVGFVAKEAVISSWAQTHAVEDPGEGPPGELGERIKQDFAASSGGHTLPAVIAFLVFLLAYTPCVATLAAQRREIGMKWTAFGIALQLATAWVMAVAVFQVGRLFW